MNRPNQPNQLQQANQAKKSRLSEVKTGIIESPERVFLYGQEGVGKSTWLATCPGIIVLGETDGTRRLDIARYPSPNMWSWGYVLDATEDIMNEQHQFKAIGIDGLDWLEPMCWDCVCQEGDAKGPRRSIKDFGFQEGYVAALGKWRDLQARLDRLRRERGMHVIVTAHSVVKTQTLPGSDVPFDHYEPALYSGKNASSSGLWKGWCDHLLFAHHDDLVKPNASGKGKGVAIGTDERIVETRHTASWDAKSRYPLPEQMPLESGWQGLMDAIGTSAPNESSTIVAQINFLLERIGDDSLTSNVKETAAYSGSNSVELTRLLNRVTQISKERENVQQ